MVKMVVGEVHESQSIEWETVAISISQRGWADLLHRLSQARVAVDAVRRGSGEIKLADQSSRAVAVVRLSEGCVQTLWGV
jgi:hypothetical protein